MLTTVTLIVASVLTPLLVLALGVVCLLWRSAVLDARTLADTVKSMAAELDALSIAGPRIDTRTGAHDALPIREDIRDIVTAYCESMWRTPNGDTK